MEKSFLPTSLEPVRSLDYDRHNRLIRVVIEDENDFFAWLRWVTTKFSATESSRWLFRGHWNNLWNIYSSAVRYEKYSHPGFDAFFDTCFLPNRPEDKLLEIEQQLISKCRGYVSPQMSTLQLLCEMQHCGIPTRLVDFTSNPIVALFMMLYGGDPSGPRTHVVLAYRIKSPIESESFDAFISRQTSDLNEILKRDTSGLVSDDLSDRLFIIRAPQDTYRTNAQSAFFMTKGRYNDVLMNMLIRFADVPYGEGVLQPIPMSCYRNYSCERVALMQFDFSNKLDTMMRSFLSNIGMTPSTVFPKCKQHSVFDKDAILADRKFQPAYF